MAEANGSAAQQTAPTPVPTGNGDEPRKMSGKKRAGIVLLILLVVGLVVGLRWWVHSRTHISTDNAFIEAHIHSISSRVPGTIAGVLVRDNQYMHKGDLLVELDPADYQVRMENATAELDMARNETSSDYAAVGEAKAAVGLAEARLAQAGLDLQRGRNLLAKEVVPREQVDRLETARKVAASQLREAEEKLKKEQANLGLTGSGNRDARVAQKQAKLEEARLNSSYTRIFAPSDGYITRKSAEVGNIIQAGQPLMALVPLEDAWIVANYKESQLTHVAPGQEVEFTVDAYPGRTFRGNVESIMAGTGAAFSLLPPENATGNYVKVVQRIPVKIVIDSKTDPQHLLRVGMSVEPQILTGRSFMDALSDLNPFK